MWLSKCVLHASAFVSMWVMVCMCTSARPTCVCLCLQGKNPFPIVQTCMVASFSNIVSSCTKTEKKRKEGKYWRRKIKSTGPLLYVFWFIFFSYVLNVAFIVIHLLSWYNLLVIKEWKRLNQTGTSVASITGLIYHDGEASLPLP